LPYKFGLYNYNIYIFTDNLQTPEESITNDKNNESNISTCETSDIKFNNTDDVKEELSLSVENGKNIQTFDRESMIIFIY